MRDASGRFRTRLCATLAAAVLALAAPGAQAAELLLRVADVYPVGHPVPEGTIRPFMEAVKKASNGRIDFQFYPSEQLAKSRDVLSAINSGIGDIGLITPGYVTDKMPLSGVSEVPGGYLTSCQGSQALWDLTHGDGILAQKEMTPNGVIPLITYTFTPYQAFSTRLMTSFDDLKGQRIRTSGAMMDITARKLGGVPMHITAPETHEALSRGTLDGVMFAYESVFAYDLVPYLKSATDRERLSGTLVSYMMSLRKFRSLAPDVQAILLAAGKDATMTGCRAAELYARTAVENLRGKGVAIYTTKPEERTRIDGFSDEVAAQWAADIDKRGKPGTETLAAFREAVKRYVP